MRKFIRTRREAQVRKLDHKIARLTEYINGLDESLYPDEVRYAEQQRGRAWLKRRNLVSQLPKENHVPA